MPADRRHPHRPFDRSLIRGFLRGRDVVAADLLPAGKSNSNYKLALSDGERVVLRLYSHGSAEREAHVMDLVRDLVPVPRELDRGDTWAVFSFVDGELLADAPEHAGAAAEALAKIATVSFAASGWIEADGSVSPFPFAGAGGFIEQQLEKSEVRARLGTERVGAIAAVVRRERARLAELDAESRLVHGDFNPSNVLVREGKISGIVDWEFCHSGTPYVDVGNLLRHTAPDDHAAVKSGLEAGGMDLPDDWRQRAELADLTSYLEFLTSARSDRFKRRCVAGIDRFLAQATGFPYPPGSAPGPPGRRAAG